VSGDVDRDVRLFVYRRFVDAGEPPTAEDVAEALGLTVDEAVAAFRRLEAARVLVLAPGTVRLWMANPLCAFPTTFWIATARGAWWGTCVWDALGIPAMLAEDATVSTLCADCSEPLELHVTGGSLRPTHAVAHFAVPARRWWDNIGYT
jgi:hypothetical protein